MPITTTPPRSLPASSVTNDESDASSGYGSGSDYETERYDRIQALRAAKIKVPRKLRTHNLRFIDEYCEDWGPEEGIRELMQNFLDGICSKFNTSIDDVEFHHKESGGPDKLSWEETWLATKKGAGKKAREYGRITRNRKTDALTIVNADVTLSESVLLTGASNKRNSPNQIGGHGEGMKIGILRLLVNGSKVKYRTGGQIWKFFMKKPPGSDYQTLHYKTKDSRAARRDLEVFISNVQDEDFILENFLPLSRHLQTTVAESRCEQGHLISQESAASHSKLGSKRVYAKGLFVWENSELQISVNLTRARVNRDRQMIVSNERFKKAVANIWAEALKNEFMRKDAYSRKWTKTFLDFAQRVPGSIEHQSMEYMGKETAKHLHAFILNTTPNAFPYKTGDVREAEVIYSSLKKKPYAVHGELLNLLKHLPEVTTSQEAQEKAFLSDASTSDRSVFDLPLAQMVVAFVLQVFGDSIAVKFHRPSDSGIDALLKENTLICSELLVQAAGRDEGEVLAVKLKALASVEQELSKGKDESESRRISFEMMSFVASPRFRSFLSHEPSPTVASPTTPEELRGNETPPPCENDHDDTANRVGTKRPLPNPEVEGPRFQAAVSPTAEVPVQKKTRLSGARVPQKSLSGEAREEEESDVGPSYDADHEENGDDSDDDDDSPVADAEPSSIGQREETPTDTTAHTAEATNEEPNELATNEPAPNEDTNEGATNHANTPTIRETQVPGPEKNGRGCEHPHPESASSVPHCMSFAVPDYTVEVMHKLIPTRESRFSIVQRVCTPSEPNRGSEMKVNLGAIFPACRTSHGDIAVSVVIRKNSEDS